MTVPIIVFLFSIAFQVRGVYEPVNAWLLDKRMKLTPIAASDELAIIAIDTQSLKDVGTWPWSRTIHADMLDQLVALNAGAILFDIDFAFPSDPEGDQAFADALDRAGGGTLLATFSQTALNGEVVQNQPIERFAQRSWPAIVAVSPDKWGLIRTYKNADLVDGQIVPSAGVLLAGSYSNDVDNFTINYGISPDEVPIYSASDLLDGSLSERDIAGRSILIGAVATELGDHYVVPLHNVISGVMIHALAAETLIQRATITHASALPLLPILFVALCTLQYIGRRKAWRVVVLVALTSLIIELAALVVYKSYFVSVPTALFHPALVFIALGRLAITVNIAGLLIKRQKVQVENAERLREHIFENSSDGYMAVNEQGKVVFQSDIAVSLLNDQQPPKEILELAKRVLGQPDGKPLLSQLSLDGTPDPKSIELHANASDLRSLDPKNNLVSEPLALITLRDVTDLKQQERQIEFLSRHDDQSSALRRHSFVDAIKGRIKDDGQFAVVTIGLRRLRAVNATLGRDFVDQVVVQAVYRLLISENLGEVARLDGNVLSVIIPNIGTEQDLLAECKRIRQILIEPYPISGSQIRIGLNIGYIASDPSKELTAEDYLARAQDALMTSIDAAAGNLSSYNVQEGETRARSRRLEHALYQALERGEFHLLYQPQYRLSDRKLIGTEALLRWNSPEFGNVSPVEFIPIAESSGFINELGRFVLDTSIKDAVDLPDHITMSPNVSVLQLLMPDFPDQVAELLDRHGLAPQRLSLELTESKPLNPDSEAVARLRAVTDLGVSWALDDFGTGYSSLSYFKELPFEKIKLDRSFLTNIFQSPEDQNALRSIVQLVQGYGKTLLCEGTETEKEVELLTQIGVDSAQGYYFCRPEPFEHVKELAEQPDPTPTQPRDMVKAV